MRRRDFLLADCRRRRAVPTRQRCAQQPKTVTLWHHLQQRNRHDPSRDQEIQRIAERLSDRARLVPYTQITAETDPGDRHRHRRPISSRSTIRIVASYRVAGPVHRPDRPGRGLEGDRPVEVFQGTADLERWKGRRTRSRARSTRSPSTTTPTCSARRGSIPTSRRRPGREVRPRPRSWPIRPRACSASASARTSPSRARSSSCPGCGRPAARSTSSTQPEATEALRYWADMVQKGYASRDVINQPQDDVINSFLAGNYAMAVGGPWELPRIPARGEVRLARRRTLPVKDGKNIRASSLGGFHFAIPKGAKEVDGAFQRDRVMSTPAMFQRRLETAA